MFAASLSKATTLDDMTPRVHQACDTSWLPAVPVVVVLLLVVAFNVMSLGAGQTASLETGVCSQLPPAAVIHRMVALH